MNLRSLVLAPLFVTPLIIVAQTANDAPPVPPPVAQATPALTPAPRPATEQQLYAPAAGSLIAPETTRQILEKFRAAYATPRIVVYVNRALVDTTTGVKLTGRTEAYEQNGNAAKTSGTNTYRVKEAAAAPLADQQTVREVERLFGRVLRNAGAQLADQKTAAALLPDQPGAHIADQAAKDRQALANVADIAIEVLISSRNLVLPEVSGDATYAVPDIQATAIRLKDAAIVGQAAASDIIGKGTQAGRVVRQFDMPDITEATAIALMEDMLTGATK